MIRACGWQAGQARFRSNVSKIRLLTVAPPLWMVISNPLWDSCSSTRSHPGSCPCILHEAWEDPSVSGRSTLLWYSGKTINITYSECISYFESIAASNISTPTSWIRRLCSRRKLHTGSAIWVLHWQDMASLKWASASFCRHACFNMPCLVPKHSLNLRLVERQVILGITSAKVGGKAWIGFRCRFRERSPLATQSWPPTLLKGRNFD
jgi:hypothetical protein